ncbi:MAG: ATP synthase F1 subunit gamma [Planctomycetota bacterium JB042]
MAKGIRELKGRIRGVGNIAKITRAMEMVATTKLKRLQERAEGARPYSDCLRAMVGRLADQVSADEFPLLKKRDGGKVGLLAVTADKGLCGAYNSNMFKAISSFAKERPGRDVALFMFGARGAQYFRHRAPKLAEAYDDGMEKIPFVRVRDVVQAIAKRFVDGELTELHLASTRFESQARQVPEVRQLLPIDAEALLGEGADAGGDFIFEPSVEEIFERLLPKYLEVQVYGAILEALASEMAMKRAAMKAATDAANDMIGGLTRQYNRARQEGITNELLEIIGGAEALNG